MITTNPLYLRLKGRSASTLGAIEISGIVGPWSGADGGLRLAVQYRPPANRAEGRLVGFDASIFSATPARRPHGRVRPLDDPPGSGLLGKDETSFWWVWHLTPEDIEVIERERASNAKAETVLFNLGVHGVASLEGEPWGFNGETQFSMTTSEWLALLRTLGYTTPPSIQDLAGQALIAAPSWTVAQEKMQAARRHLDLGEDRQALHAAYGLFDAIGRNPYLAKWDELLADSDMPAEKTKIIRDLLRAQGQVLNKLGRHPSDELTAGGERQMLPPDHWEAELVIDVAQLLLTGVERWRALREAHDDAGSGAAETQA